MHPRNRHQNRYDLKKLSKAWPTLAPFVAVNKFGVETIDFSNPEAVKALNQAILLSDYGVKNWDFPKDYLCPPIPGRADTIHVLADLIGKKGPEVRVLDIGTGANLIYPLIGAAEYGWTFVGTDVHEGAIAAAKKIIQANPQFFISVRHQPQPRVFLTNVVAPGESFEATVCNPPFHASLKDALAGTERKWKNLGKGHLKDKLNFGGGGHELWCDGGERGFVSGLIQESVAFKNQVKWFTTLVSREENLPPFEALLKQLKVRKREILTMEQGQKKSRLLAWSF